LAKHYKLSPEGQALAERQDYADVGAMKAMARAIRRQQYNGVNREQGGAEAADLMKRYGAVSEFKGKTGDLIVPAERGFTPTAAHRARELGIAAAEHKAGLILSGWRRVGKAIGMEEDAIDPKFMRMMREYKGAAPVPPAPAIYPQPTNTHFQQPGVGPTRLSPRALDSLLNMGGSGKSAAGSAAAMVNESPLDYAPLANDAAGAAHTLRLAPNPTPAPNTWLPSQLSGRPAAQSAPILAQAPPPPLMGTGAGSAIQSARILPAGAPNLQPYNPSGMIRQPQVKTNAPITPESVEAFAQRNGINMVEALRRMQFGER